MSEAKYEERRKPLLTVIGCAFVSLGLIALGLFVFTPDAFGSAIQAGALTLPIVPASLAILGSVILCSSFSPNRPAWIWTARFASALVLIGACLDIVTDGLGLESAFNKAWYLLGEPTGLFALDIFNKTPVWFAACASALLLISFKGRSTSIGQLVACGVLAHAMFSLLGASLARPFVDGLDPAHLTVGLFMGLSYSGFGISVLLTRPEEGFLERFIKGVTARRLMFALITAMVFMPIALTLVTTLAMTWLPDSETAMIGVVATALLLGLSVSFFFALRILDREEQTALRAIEKLGESEYSLNLAQSYGGVGSWKWDFAEEKLYLSEQFCLIYGIDEQIVSEEMMASLNHPEDCDLVDEAVRRSLEEGEQYEVVNRIVRPDGTIRWLEKKGNVQSDDAGNPVSMHGIAIDVTDRVLADEKLKDVHERFERITANAPGTVFQFAITKDGEMRLPYVSSGVESVFGISAEACMTVPGRLFSMVHPDDRESFFAAIEESHKSLTDYSWVGQAITARGELKWVQINSRPTRQEDGSTVWDGIATDVTESKFAQAVLEQTTERLDFLLSESPTVVYECQPEKPYELMYVAPNIERLFLFEPDYLIGLPVFGTVNTHPDDFDAVQQHEERFLEFGSSTAEYRIASPDGSFKWVRDEIRRATDEHGQINYVVGAWLEITEQKTAAIQLAESESRYERMAAHVPGVVFQFRLTNDNRPSFTYLSPGTQAMLELEPEVIAKRPPILFSMVSDEGRRSFIRELLRSRRFLDDYNWSHRVELKSGGVKWIQITARPSQADDGTTVWDGLVTDVTEIEEAKYALAKSQEQYADVVNSTSEAIITIDANGDIVRANPGTELMFGYQLTELESMNVRDLMLESDGEALDQKLSDYDPMNESSVVGKRFERTGRRSDGDLVPIELAVSEFERDGERFFTGVARDITERKAMEDALKESEERFRFMSESSPVGIGLRDADGSYVYLNQTFEQIMSFTLDDFAGEQWQDSVHQDDRDRVRKAWGEFFESQKREPSEEFLVFEARWVRRDGKVVWVQVNTSPIIAEGKLVNFVTTVQDVTSRKEAEMALVESEERFRIMSEAAPVGILITDREGAVIYANEAYVSLMTVPFEKTRGWGWADYIHPDDIENLTAEWKEYLEVGGSFKNDHRIIRPDGSVAWLSCVAAPLRSESDTDGHVVMLEDITARTEAQNALRESEERFRAMSESSPVGIAVADREGSVTYCNKAFEDICGTDSNRVMSQGWTDSLHPDDRDRVTRSWDESRNKDGLFTTEHRLLYSDDSMAWVFAIVAPMYDEGGGIKGYTMLLQDVTDRKNAELESEQARRDAEKANQAKSEFLSRMSHELRTPMNSIIGFAQLLDMDELSSRQRESVDQILSGGRHLLSLINEVLDIARIESGNLSVSLEPVQLAPIITNAIEMLQPMAREKEVALNWDKVIDGSGMILADRQRMSQVLLNLVSNGIKYNRPGGHVDVSMDSYDAVTMRITINDTGIGISDEMLGRLFTPFDRLGADQMGVEGTGLGLALSSRLLEAMGGQLDIASEEGVGTTVTMLFPMTETVAPVFEEELTEVVTGADNAVLSVLLIEDNEANIRLMEKIFGRKEGYDLMVAMTGGLGLELAKKYVPDLIVLDVNLPDSVGTSVLDTLSDDEDLRIVPVIVLSAETSQSQIDEFTKAGALAYLTKPVDIGELLSVINANIVRT